MPEPVRVDEWLAELQRLESEERDGPEGFSVRQVAQAMKIGHRAAAYRVQDWMYRDHVEFAGFRKEVNAIGQTSHIPVYRLKGVAK